MHNGGEAGHVKVISKLNKFCKVPGVISYWNGEPEILVTVDDTIAGTQPGLF